MEARTRPQEVDLDVLDAVQRRVLWLATAIVHHANRVRPNPSGIEDVEVDLLRAGTGLHRAHRQSFARRRYPSS